MKHVLFTFVMALFLASAADARPPRQHFIKGTLASFDRDKIVLAATTGKTDAQNAFAIVTGRTRFREDGKTASVEQLRIGRIVRIYYKRERGVLVAIDVSWKTPAPS